MSRQMSCGIFPMQKYENFFNFPCTSTKNFYKFAADFKIIGDRQ